MKKLMIGLISLMFATVLTAAPYNTNIALWKGTVASPVTYIDGTGNIIAPSFAGNASGMTNINVENIPLTAGNIIVGSSAGIAIDKTLHGDATIDSNATFSVTNAALVRAKLDDAQSLTGMAAAGIVGYVATDANPGEITVTTNVPVFTGQWLIGTTSNDVWLSIGTTTNDWVVIQDPS